MESNASKLAGLVAAGLIAAIASPVAWATPVSVTEGQSGVVVGTYEPGEVANPVLVLESGPTTELAEFDGGTIEVVSAVVATNLNPYPGGTTFAFAVITNNVAAGWTLSIGGTSGSTGAFAPYETAVEDCDPVNTGASFGCAASTSTVARSNGILTFSDLVTDEIYGIFTNASGYGDPTACFNGPAGTAPTCVEIDGPTGSPVGTSSVPEPATLSLLGLGLAVVGFMRRRKPV